MTEFHVQFYGPPAILIKSKNKHIYSCGRINFIFHFLENILNISLLLSLQCSYFVALAIPYIPDLPR